MSAAVGFFVVSELGAASQSRRWYPSPERQPATLTMAAPSKHTSNFPSNGFTRSRPRAATVPSQRERVVVAADCCNVHTVSAMRNGFFAAHESTSTRVSNEFLPCFETPAWDASHRHPAELDSCTLVEREPHTHWYSVQERDREVGYHEANDPARARAEGVEEPLAWRVHDCGRQHAYQPPRETQTQDGGEPFWAGRSRSYDGFPLRALGHRGVGSSPRSSHCDTGSSDHSPYLGPHNYGCQPAAEHAIVAAAACEADRADWHTNSLGHDLHKCSLSNNCMAQDRMHAEASCRHGYGGPVYGVRYSPYARGEGREDRDQASRSRPTSPTGALAHFQEHALRRRASYSRVYDGFNSSFNRPGPLHQVLAREEQDNSSHHCVGHTRSGSVGQTADSLTYQPVKREHLNEGSDEYTEERVGGWDQGEWRSVAQDTVAAPKRYPREGTPTANQAGVIWLERWAFYGQADSHSPTAPPKQAIPPWHGAGDAKAQDHGVKKEHGLKGRPSNNAKKPQTRQQFVEFIRLHWDIHGPKNKAGSPPMPPWRCVQGNGPDSLRTQFNQWQEEHSKSGPKREQISNGTAQSWFKAYIADALAASGAVKAEPGKPQE